MNANCYGVWCIGALLLCLAFPSPVFADPALLRPFDPKKIPMDNGWEEFRAFQDDSAPCGKNLLYERWDAVDDNAGNMVTPSKISVRDVETNAVRETRIPEEHSDFRGCTPDSRYLFTSRPEEGSVLDVYDTRTMRKVYSWLWPKSPGYAGQILSPDGHYLVWHTDGEVMLGGDWKIKTIPLFKDVVLRDNDFVWSPDSRKVYIYSQYKQPNGKNQRLFIYDVQTKKLDTFWLEFDLPKFEGTRMLVHPETGRIYIMGGIQKGYDVYSRRYLFSFDPAAIPNGGKATKIHPERVGDLFAGFGFGPDNTIIFSMMANDEMGGDMFPEEYNGIFLATLDGKILRRITKRTYDYCPYYWKEQDIIFFHRIPPPVSFEKITSMKRRAKTPAQ